ncbi:MAG TPA: BON domain-containing protein, partial [Bryobacteraceae bacterium]|nr:BON domain-containing protein [Bryobacteraceae bacterium]
GVTQMKALRPFSFLLAVALSGALIGCSSTSTKSPDVSTNVRNALNQAGFKNVSTSQDLDKGVVTLTGTVTSDAAKAQAQSVAESQAAGQVVSNQIAVVPPGDNHDAKAVNSDLDKGIEKNLDAALIYNKVNDGVKYSVKNHVVTLTGTVNSQDRRQRAQDVAAAVPNVQQVVNELQIKNQKATASN